MSPGHTVLLAISPARPRPATPLCAPNQPALDLSGFWTRQAVFLGTPCAKVKATSQPQVLFLHGLAYDFLVRFLGRGSGFKRLVFDDLQNAREACQTVLFALAQGGRVKQFCWHPDMPNPALQPRRVPRLDSPLVFPYFGLDRMIRPFVDILGVIPEHALHERDLQRQIGVGTLVSSHDKKTVAVLLIHRRYTGLQPVVYRRFCSSVCCRTCLA